MRRGRHIVAILAPLLVGGLAATGVLAWWAWRSPPRVSRPVVWDFTRSWDVSRVNWPATETGHVWWVAGPQPIEIRLPDGRRFTYTVQKAQVRRKGNTMDVALLYFDHEPLDAARDRATALLRAWGATPEDLASLDKWRESRRGLPDADRDPRPTEWSIDRNGKAVGFAVQVAVARTPAAPWVVVLAFGPADRPK